MQPKNPHPGKPPTPPHKLVVVNGKRKGKVRQHVRRVPQKPPNPYDTPPPDPRGAAA